MADSSTAKIAASMRQLAQMGLASSLKIDRTSIGVPAGMATLTQQPTIVRRRVRVRGVVQGVGFRPFVYNLARNIGLRGFVFNSSSGVTIEVEGAAPAIEQFLDGLQRNPPVLARIEEFTTAAVDPCGDSEFVIHESLPERGEFALISPDVATCADCWNDVKDPANRRYGYPFTNCTNCGPRYTIIRDIPYDRPMTTMAAFRMCPECEAEYHDPANRRFHAQPNACPDCGPTLALAQAGTAMPDAAMFGSSPPLVVLGEVRRVLREGAIVAVKSLGGFHLACDAMNEDALRRLRSRKKRSDKPFAVMARDVEAVESFCIVSDADRELLLSVARPIVILPRLPNAKLGRDIAPGNDTVGVMLPPTPLHLFLFGADPGSAPEFPALVMTSGNISDEPIVTSNLAAWEQLAGVADWFLFHNRDIYMRTDDSVAKTFEERPRILRRSRGYAPQPIELDSAVTELLACGAELKNTFCVTKGRYAFLSQHIGDVDNYETLQFLEETLANIKKLFRVEPKAVAHDLHPLYLTSRFARQLPLRKIGVQHHHAHVASCMAENRVREKVIGVAFDGTGYGSDGQIWGGEFLVADFAGFERRAHFRYIPLAGGDAAVRQVWRSALSWLREAYGKELPSNLPLLRKLSGRQVALVSQMLDRSFNTVLTSSCGRLFDAVAALIGICNEATFEGQAAIELEVATVNGVEGCYPFEIEGEHPTKIDMRSTIRAIVADLLKNGQSRNVIASRFHNTIAEVIAEVCRRIRRSDGLRRVCLSGGTFQNLYLLDRATRLLRQSGFEVFLHSRVPPNDGGIALGQAVIANESLQRGA